MKNKIPFIAAVVIGLVAIMAIRSYVQRVEEDAKAKLKGQPVIAARMDIADGAEIALEMVTRKEVPIQFIPPQAIRGEMELKQVMGRKVRIPIKAGQILLWSDLATERQGGLASLIPEGEGAFTVNISQGIDTALIQPNDRIDIIASFTAPKGDTKDQDHQPSWRQSSDLVNVVLMQNVTVLAVGQNFGEKPGKMPGESGGGGGGMLTLSITVQEAQLMMFAAQHGELGAVLRKEGSLQVIPRDQMSRVTFQDVEKIIGKLDGQRSSLQR